MAETDLFAETTWQRDMAHVPLAAPSVMPLMGGKLPEAPRKSGELTVLVVDDDDIDAMLAFEALERDRRVGTIVRACDGDEAFHLLSRGMKPDLALVDLAMPIVDGLSFLRKCQERGLDSFPFVVLTTSRTSEDAYRSYRRGACLAITKPTRAEHYDDVIARAIGLLFEAETAVVPGAVPNRPRFMNVETGRGPAVTGVEEAGVTPRDRRN